MTSGEGPFTSLADVDDELRDQLRGIARGLAMAAGELIVTERPDRLGVAATKSSDTDVVTIMDQRSEAFLHDRIAELRPNDGVLGEEGAAKEGTSGLTWIVDPIDGTVNYLYSHPFYAVSVAVVVGDVTTEDGWETVAAAVSAPVLGETYSAAVGAGASVESRDRVRELQIVEPASLDLALIGTGFGYASKKRAAQAEVVASLLPKVRDIRRGGSAALDLCFVAAGRLDGYYESGINPWDRAAGQLIAAEAGAIVSGGSTPKPNKELTVAAAGNIHDALCACVVTKPR